MAAKRTESKKRFIGKTILCGVVSACLYAAVFTHADLVMQLFTRGGIYAALPVATVLVFFPLLMGRLQATCGQPSASTR